MASHLIPPQRAYKYEALSPGYIRLFRIRPSNEPYFSLEVSHYNLLDHSCPKSTALSYPWEGQEPHIPYLVDETLVFVTGNVDAFLRQQQRSELLQMPSVNLSDVWYWIDAICIDQDNIHERTTQVNMMQEIYIGAESICIWLGEPRSQILQSFQVIQEYHENRQLEVQQVGDAVHQILSRPYWKRSWVLQEATTPKPRERISVMCGPAHIFLEDLLTVSASALRRDKGSKIFDVSTFAALRTRRLDQTVNLHDVLPLVSTLEASDERDKLFASLQLCQDIPWFKADYSLRAPEVMYHFAVNHILHTRTLRILAYSRYRNVFPGILELPEWVPTWRAGTPAPFPPQLDSDFADNGLNNMRFNTLSLATRRQFEPNGWLRVVATRLGSCWPFRSRRKSERLRSASGVIIPDRELKRAHLTMPNEFPTFVDVLLSDSAKPESTIWAVVGSQSPLLLDPRKYSNDRTFEYAYPYELVGECHFPQSRDLSPNVHQILRLCQEIASDVDVDVLKGHCENEGISSYWRYLDIV